MAPPHREIADVFPQIGGGVQHVLTVVQDDQQPPPTSAAAMLSIADRSA
jgi:hypothetical protein